MVNNMQDNVYGKLYDVVQETAEKNNTVLACTKEAFLFAVNIKPGVCDGLQMEHMDNESFFQSAYYGLLNRMPEQVELESNSVSIKSESTDAFREHLMHRILMSAEASTKGTSFINNTIVSTRVREHAAIEQIMQKKEIGNKPGLVDYLYAIYLKFPAGFRGVMHRIVRGKS